MANKASNDTAIRAKATTTTPTSTHKTKPEIVNENGTKSNNSEKPKHEPDESKPNENGRRDKTPTNHHPTQAMHHETPKPS